MRDKLVKSVERNQVVNIMYLAKNDVITERKIKVFQVGEVSFRGYCYLRCSNRTFTIKNILALVPVTQKENWVI